MIPALILGGSMLAGSIFGGIMNNRSVDKTNELNLKLAEQKRIDDLMMFNRQQGHIEAMNINDRLFRNEQAREQSRQQRYVNAANNLNQAMAQRLQSRSSQFIDPSIGLRRNI